MNHVNWQITAFADTTHALSELRNIGITTVFKPDTCVNIIQVFCGWCDVCMACRLRHTMIL